MKLKGLSAAIALGCAVASGSASAIVVGGVDFGALGLTAHIETSTLAETLVLADGDVLEGYGVINVVNGNSNYAAGNNMLYFTFTDYVTQNFSATETEFTGGVVNVYFGDLGAASNLLGQDSPTNVANIQALSEWVSFTGHGNLGGGASANATIAADGTLTGQSISFTGQGLLDVDTTSGFGLADVIAYLDSDGVGDAVGGFADVALGTEGNQLVLNPFDTCDNQTAGQWCIQGTASLRGLTNVPAPGAIALIGAGLLGFGAMTRRKKA